MSDTKDRLVIITHEVLLLYESDLTWHSKCLSEVICMESTDHYPTNVSLFYTEALDHLNSISTTRSLYDQIIIVIPGVILSNWLL